MGGLVWAAVVVLGTRSVSGGLWDVPGLVPLVAAGGVVQARDHAPPAPQVGPPGGVERRRDGSVRWDRVVVLLVAAVVVFAFRQALRPGGA